MKSQAFWNTKDVILFLIDCNPDMFEAAADDASGDVPFYDALNCARAVSESKVFTSSTDLVGIVLYNTVRTWRL